MKTACFLFKHISLYWHGEADENCTLKKWNSQESRTIGRTTKALVRTWQKATWIGHRQKNTQQLPKAPNSILSNPIRHTHNHAQTHKHTRTHLHQTTHTCTFARTHFVLPKENMITRQTLKQWQSPQPVTLLKNRHSWNFVLYIATLADLQSLFF